MAETRSPRETAAPSQKRPLEEPSSPSGPADGPNAKRPALDKILKDSDTEVKSTAVAVATAAESTNGDAELSKTISPVALPAAPADKQGNGADTAVPRDVNLSPSAPVIAASNGHSEHRATSESASANHVQDETNWLHLRAIISSAEAATVIGKGGENVTQIRRLAGAKCTVSEYSRGAVERILTVSGLTDAVAKAFGLIIRTLNQEPLEAASTPQSKTYPLRLLIPNILIGSIIGKGGVRIREIQEASGARLNASESCLPFSSERSLVVLGVADAVHIATYYVGRTLVEQMVERFGGPAVSNYASRHGGQQGSMPGGMTVAPYNPMPAGGQVGHAEAHRKQFQQSRGPPAPYGAPYGQPYPQAAMPHASPRGAYAGVAPQQAYAHPPPQAMHPAAAPQPVPAAQYPGQSITQQIYIPNDMVGAIIGKGGAKINEIRTLSGSVIKINEPQDNSNERLVTVTGPQECNQMALYMLYSRLGESSKNSNAMMPR